MFPDSSEEPNPVAQIIGQRTLEVGGAAGAALAALLAVNPAARRQVLPLALGGGALVAGGLSAYFVATFNPRFPSGPGGARLIARLPPSHSNAVALTFDDGPHPDSTPRLLDILAEQGAVATFFVVGASAARYPRLVRRIANAGHAIGVHGLRHRTMVLQNGPQIRADLRAATAHMEDALGSALPRRLLRPPYGFKTWTLCQAARAEGFTLVAWSCDPRDYDAQKGEEGKLAARAIARLASGDIVLLHDRPDRPATPAALPALLAHLAARNWTTVTVG